MLQDVSSSLQVGDNRNCVTFLQSKAAMLKPSELLINIQLNEIYVKPKLQYTADRIVGMLKIKNKLLRVSNVLRFHQ